MAQSFGYLLAAVGPVFVGTLYDISRSWTMPIAFLIVNFNHHSNRGVISGKEGLVSDRSKTTT